ncbi:MAG: hypothetical protein LBU81_08495 [Methanosarcinales archaeon]|nr:hypothetical protein [Methanosarcinales archaeon]
MEVKAAALLQEQGCTRISASLPPDGIGPIVFLKSENGTEKIRLIF